MPLFHTPALYIRSDTSGAVALTSSITALAVRNRQWTASSLRTLPHAVRARHSLLHARDGVSATVSYFKLCAYLACCVVVVLLCSVRPCDLHLLLRCSTVATRVPVGFLRDQRKSHSAGMIGCGFHWRCALHRFIILHTSCDISHRFQLYVNDQAPNRK